MMNQKDWVEYFEAINGRKPKVCKNFKKRVKREFVVERKKRRLSNWGAGSLLRKHLLPKHLFLRADFVQPQPSAKTLQAIWLKKFEQQLNKQTKVGSQLRDLSQ